MNLSMIALFKVLAKFFIVSKGLVNNALKKSVTTPILSVNSFTRSLNTKDNASAAVAKGYRPI